MTDIHVGRYAQPREVRYQGWIEPDDKTWIAFIDLEGRPVFFLDRDPVTGAIPLSDC